MLHFAHRHAERLPRLTNVLLWLGLVAVVGAAAAFLGQSQARSRAEVDQRFTERAAISSRFVSTYVSDLVARQRAAARLALAGSRVSEERFWRTVADAGYGAAVLLDERGRLLRVVPPKPGLAGSELASEYQHLARIAGSRTPLGAYLRNAMPVAGNELYLVDAAGSVIAKSGRRLAKLTTLARIDPGLARAAAREGARTLHSRGARRRIVVSPVEGTQWRVVASVPEARLYSSIEGGSRWLPWLAVGGLGLAGLLAIVLVRRLLVSHGRLAAMNAELDHVARVDALTGLHNRRHMEEALLAAVSSSRRHGRELSVLMVDIDKFKRINDTFGHPAGDAVLAQTAEKIRSSLRLEDELGRWGGEEFLAVLPSTGAEGALAVAERLRSRVAGTQAQISEHEAIDVTVTVGVSAWAGDEVAELVSRADAALYAGKEAGRDRVVMAAASDGALAEAS
jgi:diguanylate cyclase (GGDEF)-like protein